MLGNYTSKKNDSIGLLFDFRNNVIYNYSYARAGYNDDTETVSKFNFINNYYKPGPSTPGKNWIFRLSNPFATAYFSGNCYNGEIPANQWSLIDDLTNQSAGADSPLAVEHVTTVSAAQAFKDVVAYAGFSLVRDAVDSRAAKDVLNGTGRLISSPENAGGWPVLRSSTPPVDTDRDGMPDTWENINGLDRNNSGDGVLDNDNDGYTNLEEYLNSLVPVNAFGHSGI